jgi:ubiquinone/menaquinone biosynthesis C-methylase UbiE
MSDEVLDPSKDVRAEKYIHGYSDEMQRFHNLRTAAAEAAFFLPHLRPGMAVLDCGCGPGSITIDMAPVVAPGAMIGIDLAQRQIENARALAAERGAANVSFELGDISDLRFPDRSFDAAFAHNVLEHLRDPLKALNEIRRVLRPGGVIGILDDDWGALVWEPATPLLRQGTELFLKVAEQNGANFFYARHQKRFLREAGFVRIEGHAMARCYGSPERLRIFVEAVVRQFQDAAFMATVLDRGWADRESLDAVVGAVRAWGDDPDAYRAVLCPAAIGWVAKDPSP